MQVHSYCIVTLHKVPTSIVLYLYRYSEDFKNIFFNQHFNVKFRKSWNGSQNTFNIPALASILDHDNHEMRSEFRKFVSDPIMTPKYNIPLHEERDVALIRLKRICDVSYFPFSV